MAANRTTAAAANQTDVHDVRSAVTRAGWTTTKTWSAVAAYRSPAGQ